VGFCLKLWAYGSANSPRRCIHDLRVHSARRSCFRIYQTDLAVGFRCRHCPSSAIRVRSQPECAIRDRDRLAVLPVSAYVSELPQGNGRYQEV
jgi:hypothetical protein